MKKLEPVLSTAYSEVNLAFSAPPSKDTLVKISNEKEGYQKSWALNQLKNLRENGSLMTSYLARNETLVTYWDKAVGSWRKGIVFRLDNPEGF